MVEIKTNENETYMQDSGCLVCEQGVFLCVCVVVFFFFFGIFKDGVTKKERGKHHLILQVTRNWKL